MKIGDRVRIGTLENWVAGAASSMKGMTGTVLTVVSKGVRFMNLQILVKLDVAPEPWWTYQQPGREWWFKESELEVI